MRDVVRGPVTKGEPIVFRLPLGVDALVRAAAASDGVSVGRWVARQIVRLAMDQLRDRPQ